MQTIGIDEQYCDDILDIDHWFGSEIKTYMNCDLYHQ